MSKAIENIEVSYRKGSTKDALCVAGLATQVFLDTYATEGIRPDLAREALLNYSPDAFANRLSESANIFILAEHAGHLIGFAEVSSGKPCCIIARANSVELVRLYVQKPFQNSGIGRSLLKESEKIAKKTTPESLWFTVWAGNSNAMGFYRSQGYMDIGASTYEFEGKVYENRVFVKAWQK